MDILKTLEMDKNYINLFELSYDVALDQIEKIKGRVVVGST